jgi:hypothetical protein
MPLSFNFIEGNFSNTTIFFGIGPAALTFEEGNDSGGSRNVKFTVSSDAAGGSERISFGARTTSFLGGFTPIHLSLNDLATFTSGGSPTFGNDVFILRFQEVAFPSNDQLTGSGANAVAFNVKDVTGSVSYSYMTAGSGAVTGGIIAAPGAFVAPTALDGVGITGIRFSTLSDMATDRLAIDNLTANALNCFAEGTWIATPDGEVAVETLQAGDTVLRPDGGLSTVKWLGRQEVNVRISDPRKVNPICITKGALGENIPARDLWVSLDHAIGIDEYLVNAGALVNGSTIYQVAQMPREGFTYYHVETDAHELLLAEGCPAESFVDYAALDGFENACDRANFVVQEMNAPRISAARMLPKAVKDRIDGQAPRVAA